METQKILVVDDEQLISKFLKSRLTREQWEVDVASDGLDALERLNRNRYDLVITDLMIPNVAGLELIVHLRKSELNADVPVIVLSSLSSDDVIDDVLSIGAQDYLSKPFSMNVLMAKVRQLLGRSQSAA